MSSPRINLVKWTVPAFALILGFLWYKRRRADRADPGGESDLKTNCNSSSRSKRGKDQQNLNLNDSGYNFDESFASTVSNSNPGGVKKNEVVACSPRQVSESLAIPQRKQTSGLSVTPITSIPSSDPDAWYKDVEMTADVREEEEEEEEEEVPLPVQTEKLIARDSLSKQQLVQSVPKPRPKSPYETAKHTVRNQISKMLDHPEDNPKPDTVIDEIKIQERAGSERDSANHSPVSGVLDGSVSDEARSEGSSDSGKGGSISGNSPAVYEFVLPQNLIGRLIGRHGVFLHSIKAKGQVNILIKRHPETNKMKVCAIEGSQKGIRTALDMIRQKFPENKYPSVTLEKVSFLKKPEEMPWVPEVMQLKLVEGLNNDVTVINVMEPNHLFLHLPTHPSYPSLRILDQNMTQLYNTAAEAPSVPDHLEKGMVFVGKWYDRWVRVYIQKPDPHGEKNLVRLIDHGGFWILKNSEMRKIRYDYLTLPFQAIEVFIANIQPKNGTWEPEAYELVHQITQGVVVQAQIQSYVDRDTHVNLYLNIQKHGVISLADELVARGYAEPVQLEEIF